MAKQKLTDYVADFLVSNQVKHVFMLTGGGAMHLNHSLGKHPDLEVVFNHHEQASAMAAESYARLSNNIGVVNVTTGPGGVNTLNGVFGAYTDSVPMLILSGQVRYDTTLDYANISGLRQLGDQECDIVRMVQGITKHAVMIKDPKTIRYHLEKALFLATHGRPGPVWIDIPMNFQGSFIESDELFGFDASLEHLDVPALLSVNIVVSVYQRLLKAQRPVILAGSGLRLSKAHELFLQLAQAFKIPVVTAWNAHDIIEDDHPYYVGRPGTIGDRAGNFVVQNADVLLILGSRLNIRQISYNYKSFARGAYKIMVDADVAELKKPTLEIDMPVHADLRDFITQMLEALPSIKLPDYSGWVRWCKERHARYDVVLPEYWQDAKVNPYCFMRRLSELLPEHQVIVTGDGTACVTSFQAMKIKKGQRLYTNSGSASMGYDLPAAIGACVAARKPIICLAGDGSVMQNIQELATIAYHQYPIKIFILNNNGYHSIRQTQQNFFGEPLIGVGPESGLGFPEFYKLADTFNLPYFKCEHHQDLDAVLKAILDHKGPAICEIFLDLKQSFSPKLASRRLADGSMVTSPLEDMTPLLSRDEFKSNMIVEILPESM